MPIYNTRDLIPFVNQLEAKILEMNNSVEEWDINKFRLISAAGKVDSNYSTAMMALVRADEAMAEIGTATFKSTAHRGQRLADTFNQLREEMFDIAATVEGRGGGGGTLTDGMFYDELNNAIATVDVTIEDGLKLDYRLREILRVAETGVSLSKKELHVPYKQDMTELVDTFVVPPAEGVVFVRGDVTVLNAEGTPFLDEDLHIITGTVDESGAIELSATPSDAFTVYFPVQMHLKDIPEDFLYLFMQQMVQKNSRVMEVVLGFENQIVNILEDISYMKGVNWTPDFSIMKNHQEIVKEGITPKGLNVEVRDGMAHVTFSYNDHPHLSHFILEKWDEEAKQFAPVDGEHGVINK